MEIQFPCIIGAAHFLGIGKNPILTPREGFLPGHIIYAKDYVLTRHYNGFSVRRAQNVVGAHHQHPSLDLRFDGKRYMYGHLIAVKVSGESGTDQWMELNGLAFDENRLERLDPQPMQSRGTV